MIDLKTWIKNYVKFFLFSFILAIIVFIFINSYYLKLVPLNYQAHVTLFSVPKYAIPEIEKNFFQIEGKIDKMGLELFSLSENGVLTEGYNSFYTEVEQNLEKNIDFLNKFDNNPELFVKFLKVDNSIVSNIPDTIDTRTFVVHEEKVNKGIIEILTVELWIQGTDSEDVRNFINDKITTSATLFKNFMKLQISNLTNDLKNENEVKILKITELLNLRIEYLENQITIARQQNIFEPVRTAIEQGTDYLKGVNLLSLEISKVRDDLKNLNQGNHYLLYDNNMLIENIKNSIFSQKEINNQKNILFTFFYDKDFISVIRVINGTLLNLFTYYMIFIILLVVSITMIHFYFYSKKFNN